MSTDLEILSGSKLFRSQMGDKRALEQADIYNFVSNMVMTTDHITPIFA